MKFVLILFQQRLDPLSMKCMFDAIQDSSCSKVTFYFWKIANRLLCQPSAFSEIFKLMMRKTKFVLIMTRKLASHSIDMIKDAFIIFILDQLQGNLDDFFLDWVSTGNILS